MTQNLASSSYRLVCGAEIHVELATKSKMFCGCKNDPFGADKPNIYTCPVCLGLPGALPVPNKKAIEDCILIGLALNCRINQESKFDRKHYFYPDLPKAYQISQYDEPFCEGGYVETSRGRVRITRVHMEEDTAKLNHAEVDGRKVSLVDFNRSGVPLVEIVTEPDIQDGEHAKEFLKKVRDIIRALGVSSCDMEKGSMRLEANISLSKDDSLPAYKVEVKNINSFRFFANSLDYEYQRQSEILGRGETPQQETRGYRDKVGTVAQRSKEEAADYRYFPDPDIPPIVITDKHLAEIKSRLVDLPEQKIAALVKQGVSEAAAKILLASPALFAFYQEVVQLDGQQAKKVANDLVNKKITPKTTTPQDYLKSLVEAKPTMAEDELTSLIIQVLANNPKVVEDYRGGKENALGYLVGQVMKESKGQASPATVNKLLRDMLK